MRSTDRHSNSRTTQSDTYAPGRKAAHYRPTGWHHEQRCLACGAAVDYRDQALHDQREAEWAELLETVEGLLTLTARLAAKIGLEADDQAGDAGDDLVKRANEYGDAAGYEGRGSGGRNAYMGMWRAGWREAREIFRLRQARAVRE